MIKKQKAKKKLKKIRKIKVYIKTGISKLFMKK